LALALTVTLPAGGLFLPAVAAADGELPAVPDPVPVAIAGMPTLPAAPAPAADPSAVGAGLPAPAPADAVSAPAVAVAAAALRPLRLGAVGADVRDLQRALRRRGARIAVDGAFGKGTRTAVKLLQRKLGRRATGVADVALLRSLGVSPQPVVESVRLTAASVAATAAPVAATAAPVAAGLALPVGAPPAPENVAALGARFLRIFPIAGPHSYTNDFGDPRPQGRHQGVDILSPHGTPIVAVADGVIQRMSRQESGRGGLSIWLRDTAGNTYFYGHLASIADGLQDGSPLALGQQIATVGNTGDARGGPSHLHFEIHPGDNGAIDPFSELTMVDPAKAVQTPTALARARRATARPARPAPARKPGARPTATRSTPPRS
jgi:murein DD-endopeptidase MepM/ murein hydrolase activator NlpD